MSRHWGLIFGENQKTNSLLLNNLMKFLLIMAALTVFYYSTLSTKRVINA
jgi:hypothetical protein